MDRSLVTAVEDTGVLDATQRRMLQRGITRWPELADVSLCVVRLSSGDLVITPASVAPTVGASVAARPWAGVLGEFGGTGGVCKLWFAAGLVEIASARRLRQGVFSDGARLFLRTWAPRPSGAEDFRAEKLLRLFFRVAVGQDEAEPQQVLTILDQQSAPKQLALKALLRLARIEQVALRTRSIEPGHLILALLELPRDLGGVELPGRLRRYVHESAVRSLAKGWPTG